MIKKLIQSVFNSLGYNIVRTGKKEPDLSLYRQLYSQEALEQKRFYNIGAGNFYHPYWTNVDKQSDWYKANNQVTRSGIEHDLLSLENLPVEDSCAEALYTSHTIEHITDEAAQKLFDEAYRIMKPGSVFRITGPNIELAFRALQENDRHYFYWAERYSLPEEMKRVKLSAPMNKTSLTQLFILHFAASVSQISIESSASTVSDEEFQKLLQERGLEETLDICKGKCDLEVQRRNPGNHINWWSYDKLFRMLEKSGFSRVVRSGYGQSFSPVMRDTSIFDTTHPKMSLFVEAIREKD